MKKMNKKKVVLLLKSNKYTYKKLSEITGYHEKSLIRINSQLKNRIDVANHGNKNRKPHNYINNIVKNALVKEFINKKFKTYKQFHNFLISNNQIYSYSFISKLLSKNFIKNKLNQQTSIKRKMISNNIIQYNNIRYQVIDGDIKHHTEVKLYISNNKPYILYKNIRYNLKPIKKVISKTGLTKYY